MKGVAKGRHPDLRTQSSTKVVTRGEGLGVGEGQGREMGLCNRVNIQMKERRKEP